MLVSCWAQKMEATCLSKTPVYFQQTIQCYIPDDCCDYVSEKFFLARPRPYEKLGLRGTAVAVVIILSFMDPFRCITIGYGNSVNYIDILYKIVLTPWSESASELYRPSDRHLSAI
jgi:hypothetical protein